MNETFRLIITNIQDYKEYDAIVYGITEEGKVSLLAKGIRKPTSHKAYQLLLFSFVECQCSAKYINSFPVITSVNVIESYRLLREDISNQMICAIASELIYNFVDEGFELLKSLFDSLIENIEPLTSFNHYLSNFLLRNGIQFHVDDCVICGNKHINSISLNEGGFICNDCQKQIHSHIYEVEFLKKLRYIVKSTRVTSKEIRNLELNDFQLTCFLLDSIEYHLGIKLKTKKFFLDSYVELSS